MYQVLILVVVGGMKQQLDFIQKKLMIGMLKIHFFLYGKAVNLYNLSLKADHPPSGFFGLFLGLWRRVSV